MTTTATLTETGIVIKSISDYEGIVHLSFMHKGKPVTKSVTIPKGIVVKSVPVQGASSLEYSSVLVKRKGHINFQGLDIRVQNPSGTLRSGISPSGQPWETSMEADYGYIAGTEGKDGEDVDVFVGPDKDAQSAYIITIMKPPSFENIDEQKVMLGYNTGAEAKRAFMRHYDSPKFFGSMTAMTMTDFKKKVKESDGKLLKSTLFWACMAKAHLKQGEHDSAPAGYPRDRNDYADPEHWAFPIDDVDHVKAALAYFHKHRWDTPAAKKKAAVRILTAAHKYGLQVSRTDDVYRAAHGLS
ncbi:MAG: DUF6582 domain-containing protein [Acidithiobacillus ferriphilus]